MFTMFKQLFTMITVWLSTAEILGRSANNAAGALESMSVSLKEEQDFKQQLSKHDLQERILKSQAKLDQAQASYEASKPRSKAITTAVNSKPATRKPRAKKVA